MKTIHWLNTSRRRGVALIAVISALALATALLLAMFSATDTEFKATRGYVSAQSAKQFADMSVAVVQAQIQNGQYSGDPTIDPTRTTHATQPGCIQVFDATSANAGKFLKGLKLYSSSKMVETNLTSLVSDAAPADWDTEKNSARYVDLNEPVIRSSVGATSSAALYFPVIDPRAAYNSLNPAKAPATTAVEGFSYSTKTDLMGPASAAVDYASSTKSPTVVPADGVEQDKLRLPMPVEWIYLLKDGTMGTLDSENKFVTPSGASPPTSTNPIIGRMAFWTDDESCKININTASEPTFMGTPFYFHERDRRWAHYPAASNEYQRYPGHPATVALSSVLCPGYRLDQYSPDKGLTADNIRDLKDKIYGLAPKIAGGDVPSGTIAGSESGTLPFIVDDFSSFWGDSGAQGKHVDLSSAKSERLHASVDELLFKEGNYNVNTGRQANEFAMPGDTTRKLFDHDVLERTRFFLTAQSRSPEFSIHGLPRICMWPVADESWSTTYQAGGGVTNTGRTSFDEAIALCSTIKNTKGGTANGAGSYFFRRLDAYNATKDVSLPRNTALLNYLTNELTSLNYPKTGLSTAGTVTFDAKYGTDNVRQIATEIFDYVRCINLYDGVLARYNDGTSVATQWNTANAAATSNSASWGAYYTKAANTNASRYTYTNKRQSAAGGYGKGSTADEQTDKLGVETGSSDLNVLPGHGAVTPAVWTKNGSDYKGFGRSFTLSEIGLHFICTADGGDRQAPTTPAVTGAVLGDKSIGYLTDNWQVGKGTGPGFKSPFTKLSGGGTAYRADAKTYVEGNGAANAPMKLLNNSDVYGSNFNIPDGHARWWSNFPPVQGDQPPKSLLDMYGCDASKPANKNTNPTHPAYHPGFSPENWNLTLDWNTPLQPPDASGKGGEKRIQCAIDLEGFCPSLGWTKFYPEFTIVIQGNYLSQFKIKNTAGAKVPLFNTTGPIYLKSNSNIYDQSGNIVLPLGGHAGPTAFVSGRGMRGSGAMGSDYNYDSNSGGGASGTQNQLTNYGITSDFVTVKRDAAMEVDFPSAPMVIQIYDSHNATPEHLVQTINVVIPQSTLPMPNLAAPVGSVINAQTYYANGNYYYTRSLQGPHWWAFNLAGAVGRIGDGKVNSTWTAPNGGFWLVPPNPKSYVTDIQQETRGRFDTGGAPPGTNGAPNKFDPPTGATYTGTISLLPDNNSDVVRTMVPAIGDYRVLAAMKVVPASMWKPHPLWAKQMGKDPLTQLRTIHSYTNHLGNSEAGYTIAVDPNSGSVAVDGVTTQPTPKPEYAMVSKAYSDSTGNNDARIPDLPGDPEWAAAANSFGDFDTGISSAREGAYINKPDEGNFYAIREARTINNVATSPKLYRSGYFYNSYRQSDDWRNGIYMTPNRLVASPVMFGSLPTGVYGGSPLPANNASALGSLSLGTGKDAARPWQTLLFRPHTALYQTASGGAIKSKVQHPGQFNPMDHYILDLFHMPVVEPYAISEPLSVAGRVNMNYQILPFTNIRRATALHAVMKGEFLTAIPLRQKNKDGNLVSGEALAKGFKVAGFNKNVWDTFYNEKAVAQGDSSDGVFLHRPLNVDRTLDQFDERFRLAYAPSMSGTLGLGIFRSASQICELHLIPSPGQTETAPPSELSKLQTKTNMAGNNRQTNMNTFWENNPATGDNVRERPYSNLYARLTTRSNTFRVHMRTQVIQKARSTDPAVFEPTKDTIVSEYRGSTVIERYIDPNDTSNQIPDYASSSTGVLAQVPLDSFYKFRTVESKRFNP